VGAVRTILQYDVFLQIFYPLRFMPRGKSGYTSSFPVSLSAINYYDDVEIKESYNPER